MGSRGDLGAFGAVGYSAHLNELADEKAASAAKEAPVKPRFKKTKSSEWAVLGPCEVATKAGKIRKVTILGLGKPFTPKWGEGAEFVMGYLTAPEEPEPAPTKESALVALTEAVKAARALGAKPEECLTALSAGLLAKTEKSEEVPF